METNGMKMYKTLSAVLLLTCSTTSYAQEGVVILGLEFGGSPIEINSELAVLDDEFDYDGYAFGYILGYRWNSNMVVETNLNYASNDSFFKAFDYYETYEAKLMLGYSIEVNDNFRIVPLVGYTRWELEAKEGLFLNPGPEEESKADGTDFTYKLRMDFPIGELVVLSASYTKSNLEIGDIKLTQFGVKFEF